ncbi:hypothetical protein [Xanthomonas vesicatoria]|uniref:hypothetical protein n=1 Tax=Xanthomonas vesicatoria TaxID=56460 RepID=UPI001364A1B8|nr:hypothetical protein [Xanthomonas vesicatoria]
MHIDFQVFQASEHGTAAAKRRWLEGFSSLRSVTSSFFPVFFLMLPRSGVDSALAKAAKLVFFSELLLLVGPAIAYAKMRRR